MSKRTKSPPESRRPSAEQAKPSAAAPVAHPPAKNPTLLAVSIVLFVLWFVFLLVTAMWG